MGFKLQEELPVHRKRVGNCSCNYYWGGGEKVPTKAIWMGLKSLTNTGNFQITPPPRERRALSNSLTFVEAGDQLDLLAQF